MCGGERGQRRDPLSPRSRHLSSHLQAAPSWPDCRRQRTRIAAISSLYMTCRVDGGKAAGRCGLV